MGVAADDSEVLFTSHSELTEDANTGRTAGVPNHQGSDLYSYDVGTGDLTDLTVDDKPADVAAGADVERVARRQPRMPTTSTSSPAATSPRAPPRASETSTSSTTGSSTSSPAIRPASPVRAIPSTSPPTVSTPPSCRPKARPATTTPARPRSTSTAYGSGLECASCRPSGEPPTGDASIAGRALSDDGARLFFQSTDAVLPQAQSALSNVFEYVGRRDPPADARRRRRGGSGRRQRLRRRRLHRHLRSLSPTEARARSSRIYDARVNADVPPVQAPTECQGEGCRGAPTAPPQRRQPGQREIRSAGNDHGAEIEGHPRLENDAEVGAARARRALGVRQGPEPGQGNRFGDGHGHARAQPDRRQEASEEGLLQNQRGSPLHLRRRAPSRGPKPR